MPSTERVQRLAAAIPLIIEQLDKAVTRIIGDNQHNIILAVGCDDETQYASNVPREHGMQTLRDLFGRWQAGLPDTLPPTEDLSDPAFEYLLRQYDASKSEDDRVELVRYVARLRK